MAKDMEGLTSSGTSSKSKSAKAKAKALIRKFEEEDAAELQPGSIINGEPGYHYFNVGNAPTAALLARLEALGYEKAPDHVKRVGHSPAVLYCVPQAFFDYRKQQKRNQREADKSKSKNRRSVLKRFMAALGDNPNLADRLLSGGRGVDELTEE